MRGILAAATALAVVALGAGIADAAEPANIIKKSVEMTPQPPWPAGDQKGMANTLGAGTWLRCAQHLQADGAKVYELSHERSNTMPMSPFGAPLEYKFVPIASIPGTKHAFNGERVLGGEPGAQGTQMDALGHFAYLDEPWSGEGEIPADSAKYYGGFNQKDVKPTPESPLLKLGIEQVPPIITSAVLLDAKAYKGGGKALEPGVTVTTDDIMGMLKAQGLESRGILPGDVVYIYTGWSEKWKDPAGETPYYYMGPGLSYDAAQYLSQMKVVLVALDNPFTDPVPAGMLKGETGPAEGTPPNMPFAIHHENLTQSGIHNIQNANLAALAADKVWTSCTIILPLRSRGHSGSPVRPVAVGAPN